MAQQKDKDRDDWYQRWISGIADDVASNMEGEAERESRMDALHRRLDQLSRRFRQARGRQCGRGPRRVEAALEQLGDEDTRIWEEVSACLTDSAPLVTGRCAVRLTWRSNSRSATSLTQQPALRMSTVPSVNTMTRCQPGKPPAAIHSAASVGHSSSSQPAGRFQRIRSR